ncbi:hypothetical protein D5086_024773 [Populus alba]|uniref:Uncharacterized protein n=1 Tax=Populus alba TaxID=43335 RepID=A0ACC4B6H5_POPAL
MESLKKPKSRKPTVLIGDEPTLTRVTRNVLAYPMQSSQALGPRPAITRIRISEHLLYQLGRAKVSNLQDFDHVFLDRIGSHFLTENLEDIFTVIDMS